MLIVIFFRFWEFRTYKPKEAGEAMSINAITSVSLYEYYYNINNKDEQKKKTSPLADEMEKYGLIPTDSEALNIAMLNNAKRLEKQNTTTSDEQIPNSQRPWADLMYQLGISFNDDPKDDIEDINSILVMKRKEGKKSTFCINCGACTEVCPVNISPILLKNKDICFIMYSIISPVTSPTS